MMKQFLENIYVGGATEAKDVQLLRSLGINAIVNVGHNVNDPDYDPSEFVAVKVALTDDSNNSEYMKTLAVDIVKDFYNQGKVILVHCFAGFSRSTYIAARAISEMTAVPMDRILEEAILKYGDIQVCRHSPLRTEFYKPIGAEKHDADGTT